MVSSEVLLICRFDVIVPHCVHRYSHVTDFRVILAWRDCHVEVSMPKAVQREE